MRLAWLCIVATAGPAWAAEVVLDSKLHHLCAGSQREWADFPETAEGPELAVVFPAKRNPAEQTLRLRQQDVKWNWIVTLNGKRLGRLINDELDLVAVLAVPAGVLTDGDNRLVIAAGDKKDDDIRVGDIRLDDRPLEAVTVETSVEIAVMDDADRPVPCRLTITDANGSLALVGAKSDDHMAVRTGVIYTGDGSARFGLPAGTYTITAGRGFEYGIDSVRITAEPGKPVSRKMKIRREVDTAGWVSSDTHIHTLTFSKHGDATIAERMLTIAGEGIEFPIATDHNMQVDYEPYASKMGLRKHFTPVVGNEVTTKVGHFNAFPARMDDRLPDDKAADWKTIFTGINGVPGIELVVLNHPRDRHTNFTPFGPERYLDVVGRHLDDWQLRVNAVEVVTSGALQTDPMLQIHDWFGLLNYGLPVVPIGASDSHDVSRFILGQGRTYIRCPDSDPGNIDVKAAYKSLREGRVSVSLGLFAEMTVNGRFGPGDVAPAAGEVTVSCRVQGPTWAAADRVMLFANGVKIREVVIEPSAEPKVIKWQGSWTLPRPKHDMHLAVVALGPGVSAPHWKIPKPYQPASPVWKPYVLAVTGSIWLDADGDGRPTPAREYAERAVKAAAGNMADLMRRLETYDEAVAAQAADLLALAGRSADDTELAKALQAAVPAVRNGFARYADSRNRSREARRGK